MAEDRPKSQKKDAIRRDKIVIVDIEATCWRGSTPPPGEQHEIIEVGVCNLDVRSGLPMDKRSILVKPTRSKVSPFCTKLTTLTQELVDTGGTFAEACITLERDYETKTHLWGSWGEYDHKMFRKQCESFGVSYPFSDHYVNLKAVFANLVNRKKQVGMMRALKMLDIKPEGTHHRGDDDAWNIARIVTYLFKEHGRGILLDYW